ncbi:hypothetical protein [Desulfovibrio litoralis]|uniref:Uracil DNA glycosylase superfamily protein n=1 Tax=Desulfovibrio litoralis DSM 11393 TaxID=1121455 RepID=A0A1M7TDB4_9BACT|nr:hypothetical protein [Desulfovibrio litoralis]SHN68648.1 hypothetical protein SAMN02745728_01866 [Desulfovibrio litoralis DSM 11393]
MAGRPLKLNQTLSPFWHLGLRFILEDKEVNFFETSLKNEALAPNLPEKQNTVQAHSANNSQNIQHIPPTIRINQAKDTNVNTPLKTPKTNNTQADTSATIQPDFKEWGHIWQKVFLKGAPKPSPLVWSYQELGLDLLGGGDTQRRDFFKEIIKELACPKGTHVFWGGAVPKNYSDTEPNETQTHEYVFNPQIFEAGISYIRPRLIIVFDKDYLLKILSPELIETKPELRTLNNFQHLLALKTKIILLPALKDLQNDLAKTRSTFLFLQNALRGVL